MLTEEQKSLLWAFSLSHLIHYQQSNALLDQVDVGDEFLCYHYEPEFKCQSMQSKQTISKGKKCQFQPFSVKVMVTEIFDYKGVLFLQLKEPGLVSAERYSDTLNRLRFSSRKNCMRDEGLSKNMFLISTSSENFILNLFNNYIVLIVGRPY